MTQTIDTHIKGLIFDSDGTLIDTMPMHYLAWLEIVHPLGGQFSEELFYELAGVPSEKIVEIINQNSGTNLDPKVTTEHKENLFISKYLPRAKPIAPVIDIAEAHKGKLPMAVATGGTPPVISNALKTLGKENFFDAVVTAADVKHGKPAPDTFLEAARRLGVEPQYCQVFEDSEAGLEAARRAGMVATDIRPWLK